MSAGADAELNVSSVILIVTCDSWLCLFVDQVDPEALGGKRADLLLPTLRQHVATVRNFGITNFFLGISCRGDHI